ncbi:MAG TPA: outer membrane beta-barrel protein [Gemmatimonadaceae bacterium]|jgi:hypothetical protein|nr:outer membrane beta-barrel protein [Gemmatimonadaceae bacterium]
MKRIAITIALCAAATASAQAQMSGMNTMKSRSAGFFLGAGFEGTGIRSTDAGSPTESGAGGGLLVGYGLNNTWSLFAQGSGANINENSGAGTYTLGHLDLGARVHFRAGPNAVVPFLQFGLSGRSASSTVNGSTSTGTGGGVFAGGGLNVHMTPSVALSGAVTWAFGSFSNFSVDGGTVDAGSVDATSARVHLGLVWFP